MPFERIASPSRDAAEAACAAWMGDRLDRALRGTTGRVTLLLSGGSTPTRVLPQLLARPLAWDRVDCLASDERLVAADHPGSTEGMIRRLFAQSGRPLHYAGLSGETGPEAGIAAWRRARARIAWPASLGLIGIGDDAHTASLFPGDPAALDPDLRDAAVPEHAPHPHARLTLGLGALSEIPELALVAADSGKESALALSMAHPDRLPLGQLAERTVIRVFQTGEKSG